MHKRTPHATTACFASVICSAVGELPSVFVSSDPEDLKNKQKLSSGNDPLSRRYYCFFPFSFILLLHLFYSVIWRAHVTLCSSCNHLGGTKNARISAHLVVTEVQICSISLYAIHSRQPEFRRARIMRLVF